MAASSLAIWWEKPRSKSIVAYSTIGVCQGEAVLGTSRSSGKLDSRSKAGRYLAIKWPRKHSMYPTPKGDRILEGAEARLHEESLGMMTDLLADGDVDFGVPAFDGLLTV